MPADSLSLFVLAGETSGDRIAADLVRRLKARVRIELWGVGGSELIAEGLRSLYPMADLSVMGFADVVKRLPLLLWRARQTVAAILSRRPDVVVLVDAQVFSAVIARRLRRRGYTGTILLYVAPAVWAWKPERAPALRPLFEEILAVLPFEPAAMQRLGGPLTHYVGHPALARFPFRSTPPQRGPLVLLPGSRGGEINRMLPMMRDVALALSDHPRITSFVLPTPAGQRGRVQRAVLGWGLPVEVVSSEAEKLAAFAGAVAAIAKSGTVTLELALSGVPMVATYVADAGQAKRFAKYNVRFVTLPNIVLGREVVPELLFTTPEPEKLAQAARRLLEAPEIIAAQVEAFAELRALMENGALESPVVDASERVLAHGRRD